MTYKMDACPNCGLAKKMSDLTPCVVCHKPLCGCAKKHGGKPHCKTCWKQAQKQHQQGVKQGVKP